MVIADNEISGVDEKSVDVPVLVVGTESWPALSGTQTPKPKNHVEHVRPVASPRYQKPGSKRHVRPVAPPTHIAVPAYAFPPVSPVAEEQDLHQIDLNGPASVQDPSEHSMEQQQEKTGTDISESGHAVAILNSNDNNLVQAESEAEGSNEANLVQAESVQEGSREAKRRRRKRVYWTEGEHKLFLEGLEKYGKGRWKDISKELVVTKTPIQIASHAQKYFIHKNVKDIEKRKKRRSIHDTTLNKNDTSVTEIPSVEQQNELTPLVTARKEQHENPPQDTATSRQMQLVLLCPIGSTLPDMNKLEKMRNLFNLLAKDL